MLSKTKLIELVCEVMEGLTIEEIRAIMKRSNLELCEEIDGRRIEIANIIEVWEREGFVTLREDRVVVIDPKGLESEVKWILGRKEASGVLPPMLPRRDLEQFLGLLPSAAYMCDSSGQITFFNPPAARAWGREPRLNHPEDRYCGSFKAYSADGTPMSHDHCWMALCIKENRKYVGEAILERPDGSRLAIQAHASPFLDGAGNVMGAVNILTTQPAPQEAA